MVDVFGRYGPGGTPPASNVSSGAAWDPGSAPKVTGGTPVATNPSAPPVPTGGGNSASGDSKVDTPSMRNFYQNAQEWLIPLGKALDQLKAAPKVASGGFYQGSQLDQQISGAAKMPGLIEGFSHVIDTSQTTVKDMLNLLVTAFGGYENLDDMNKLDAAKMSTGINNINTDVGGIASASKNLPAT